MLGAGLFQLGALVREVKAGSVQRFSDFIVQVENRRSKLAQIGLVAIHTKAGMKSLHRLETLAVGKI